MCAVRVKNHLGCETRRRRWLLSVWLLLLASICLHGACGTGLETAETPSVPPVWPDSTLDDCHDEYMLSSMNASSTFAKEYELCELTANETQLDLYIDEELERLQIEIGRSMLCGNVEQCGSLDNDLEYFECVRNNGSRNLDLIMEINRNATSAHTRLRQDYDKVQQTLVLCTLDAQVEYMSSMRLAYEELHECRNQLADGSN